MFPHYIYQNIDILAVMTVQKNDFGFHGNRKTQGQKHQLNILYFKYQVCRVKSRHLNTFLQFRLLFHEPHCMWYGVCSSFRTLGMRLQLNGGRNNIQNWALRGARLRRWGKTTRSSHG